MVPSNPNVACGAGVRRSPPVSTRPRRAFLALMAKLLRMARMPS